MVRRGGRGWQERSFGYIDFRDLGVEHCIVPRRTILGSPADELASANVEKTIASEHHKNGHFQNQLYQLG